MEQEQNTNQQIMEPQSVPLRRGAPPTTGQLFKNGRRITGRLMMRSIILNAINLVLFLATLFIFTRLGNIAESIKEARSKELSTPSVSDSLVLQAELTDNFAKLDQFNALFADENSILDFAHEIDILKREGVIKRFTFESEDVILDITKNYGFRIAIDFEGDLERVNAAITKLAGLHYLVKPESVELVVRKATTEEETDTITYRLKGVLYVNKNLKGN